MAVRIVHLGVVEDGVIEEVRDGGREIVVNGSLFTLRELTGQFVLASEPWYGTRVVFAQEEAPSPDEA